MMSSHGRYCFCIHSLSDVEQLQNKSNIPNKKRPIDEHITLKQYTWLSEC